MKKQSHILKFTGDDQILELVDHLQIFYGLPTRNKLFPLLILTSICELASLSDDPAWTPIQRAAHVACLKAGNELRQSVTLHMLKSVMFKEVQDDPSISEDLSREELVAIAESKGLYVNGKRKSTIVEMIRGLTR